MKPAAGSTAIDPINSSDEPRYTHLAGLAGLAGVAGLAGLAGRPCPLDTPHWATSWRTTAAANPAATRPTGISIARAHGRTSVSRRRPPALTPSSPTRRNRPGV